MRRATQFCLVVLLWLASCAQGDQQARFAARFADGTRFEGQKLTGWHQVKAVPKLDDRALLDEKNPLRWLRDRMLFPGPTPTAFIETVCGDRLPCKIVDFRPQNDRSYEPLPDHFVVTPICSLAPPNENSTDEPTIRVLERFIRRVVWQQQGHDQYRPGTVVY
ncbi:MAG: hypothetical protein IH991_25450, partial [Planctomycetes bacterium]|nr:hypothetical protein [Planctomycetota bacterium]